MNTRELAKVIFTEIKGEVLPQDYSCINRIEQVLNQSLKPKEKPKNYLAFFLTMPNVGSWNGRWSGENNLYCIVKKPTKKDFERILKQKSYYYNFGDGWGANIEVKAVDSIEARKLKKESKGFHGYEWMIDQIISQGVIKG